MQLLDNDYKDNPHEGMDYDISSPANESGTEPGSTFMIVEPGESSGLPSSSTRSKRRRLGMLVHHEKTLVDDHPMEYSPEEVSGDGDCFFNTKIKLGYGRDVQTLRQIAQQN